MALWLVRAGKHGERESEALDMGIATVGWNKIGDLAAYQSRDAIAGALRTVYPNAPEARTQNHARQLWSFGHVIAPGDRVVLPLKKQAAVAWGAVASAYEYRPANPDELRHTHRVVWSDHLVARGRFSPELLYSFGASLTVCRITRNDAERRVQRYFVDDPDARPGPSQPCAPRDACDDSESDSDTAEASRLNLEAVGRDLIAQRLEREFKGHGLARLVGAILEAHGQRLRVSPPGADGGVDLLAGSGPLGLDSPTLCVQVKSGGVADVTVFRSLQGVLGTYAADHGLLVSWGGFTSAVRREAEAQHFRIRLWDQNDLLDALLQQYDRLPAPLRAELPLACVWTLVEAPEG